MAKSKHARIITGPQIVVVDAGANPQAHIQPAGNRKAVEGYNAKLVPEKRSKIFDYDPAHPDESYYIGLAKKGGAKNVDPANEFATKKIIEQNEKLQQTADKQASQIKNQEKEMAEMKKQLKALQDAAKSKNPAAKTA